MTSALVHASGLKAVPTLLADLEAAGVQLVGVVEERSQLAKQVLQHQPDLLICDAPLAGQALFDATRAVALVAPCAVIVFTDDVEAAHIAQAVESGIHAYVVGGYGSQRLRALIQLAQARFRREQMQREALEDMATRFDERKMVDRAKGILMHARQVSDDDAFQILRTVSMNTNQRLGQVSQHIIHSAHFADVVNRSGQLRMLSQRLIKLHWLQRCGVTAGRTSERLVESAQRVDANLERLGKGLSQPTYGDLLAPVVEIWARLKPLLVDVPTAGQAGMPVSASASVDDMAEQLLQGAERLTACLENAGTAAPLKVLNLAGRQRMLSQRFAKQAVLALLGDEAAALRAEAGMHESRLAFEQALTYLNGLPLFTPDIQRDLEAAGIGWLKMLATTKDSQQLPQRDRLLRLNELAVASEDLLEVFEQLSAHYERSMQMLVGG